jgi:hypothetical protein
MEKNKRLAFIAGHRGMHLPLQEVKIQMIAVPAQAKKKKKIAKTSLHQKNVGLLMYCCHGKMGGSWSRLAWAKSKTLSPK